MEKFSLLLLFLQLTSKSFELPLNSQSRIIFPDDDEIDPQNLINQRVDVEFFKIRGGTKVNDSSTDFKPIFELTSGIADQMAIKRNESFDGSAKMLQNQYGKYFQGDIMLVKEQEDFLSESDPLATRTGIVDQKYRWEDVKGYPTIPYKYWGKSGYTKKEKHMIRLVMREIESKTCIRFVPRTRETDFILIFSGDGCTSGIGRTGGQQFVSLEKDGCFTPGTITHELIHTIGFDHMHNHQDRDKFIEILWDNIKPKEQHNFNKVDWRKFYDFDTGYDYFSVMHYDPMAFSSNGRRTIVPIDERVRNLIGQRYGLSKGDVERINNMYGC